MDGALYHNEGEPAGRACGSPGEESPALGSENYLSIFQWFRKAGSEPPQERPKASVRVYTAWSTRGRARIQPCTPFVQVHGM
jgi:hypothetical protein